MPRILQAGDLINSQHTVERFLGEGAFAEVYRVKHRVLRGPERGVMGSQRGDDASKTQSSSRSSVLRISPNQVREFRGFPAGLLRA